MRAATALILLAACGEVPTDDTLAVARDADLVDIALDAARPEALLELVDNARAVLPGDHACPFIETVAASEDGAAVDGADRTEAPPILDEDGAEDGVEGPRASDTVHEIWHGGCITDDGLFIDGDLELLQGPTSSWIASEGFSARRNGVVEFDFSGAIEVAEQGALLLVDAAASWCGATGPDCAQGQSQVDLAFTIFPLDGYPGAYDGTVSGAVGGDGLRSHGLGSDNLRADGLPADSGVITIEGAWTVDQSACALEPTAGTFALRSSARHSVVMDGATACDGCAAWAIQGLEAPAWCADTL